MIEYHEAYRADFPEPPDGAWLLHDVEDKDWSVTRHDDAERAQVTLLVELLIRVQRNVWNFFNPIEGLPADVPADPMTGHFKILVGAHTFTRSSLVQFRGDAEGLMRETSRKLSDVRRLKPGLQVVDERGHRAGELREVEVVPMEEPFRIDSAGVRHRGGVKHRIRRLLWTIGREWEDLGSVDDLIEGLSA